ncbi:hypothetical protein IE81DRAFT_111156 [Ceraceosorus guamensis]|uniref:Uncharacterized protein n=1 Tax=Ceraceosorus guamensis TaxID=1522189 RepID=A0A316VZI2_9BASI|nr:hypothetical protein IE81DRAFT_111156 [Ceraceosorus guamensis]PWN42872.1 hypothetical protein IE81DRAFT_111156 [Ceraceosorus guamensis]
MPVIHDSQIEDSCPRTPLASGDFWRSAALPRCPASPLIRRDQDHSDCLLKDYSLGEIGISSTQEHDIAALLHDQKQVRLSWIEKHAFVLRKISPASLAETWWGGWPLASTCATRGIHSNISKSRSPNDSVVLSNHKCSKDHRPPHASISRCRRALITIVIVAHSCMGARITACKSPARQCPQCSGSSQSSDSALGKDVHFTRQDCSRI